MKTIKKSLLKTLFISALAGVFIFGGCKKNQNQAQPKKSYTPPSVEEMWKEHDKIQEWKRGNIQYNSKQRD